MSITADLICRAGAIPCPRWLVDAIDAHDRRRMLVLEIWMLSDKRTAFVALWIAWGAACASRCLPYPNIDPEDPLRLVKTALLRGDVKR